MTNEIDNIETFFSSSIIYSSNFEMNQNKIDRLAVITATFCCIFSSFDIPQTSTTFTLVHDDGLSGTISFACATFGTKIHPDYLVFSDCIEFGQSKWTHIVTNSATDAFALIYIYFQTLNRGTTINCCYFH